VKIKEEVVCWIEKEVDGREEGEKE